MPLESSIRTASYRVVPVHESQIDELDQVFMEAIEAQTHPIVHVWGAEATEGQIHDAQRDFLRALTDEAMAEKLAQATPAIQASSAAFKSRLLEIDGKKLVASIGFRDPAGLSPFINIARSEVLPGTISDWRELKPWLFQTFSALSPKAVLFYHPAHVPLLAPTDTIDDHVLASPARVMVGLPDPIGLERVVLRRSTNLDFYAQYKAIYDAIYIERPVLKDEVRTETPASLAYCLSQGFLFEIIVDGEWAGVVAAKWKTLAGLHGVFMTEIVLTRRLRGQRLGPVVHRRLAQAVLETYPAAVILGTISAKNPWSLQAAVKAGRIEIGAWHWLML